MQFGNGDRWCFLKDYRASKRFFAGDYWYLPVFASVRQRLPMFTGECRCLPETVSFYRRLSIFTGVHRYLQETVGFYRSPSVFTGDCRCLLEPVDVYWKLSMFTGDCRCLPEKYYHSSDRTYLLSPKVNLSTFLRSPSNISLSRVWKLLL